jgi:hypothetical protein
LSKNATASKHYFIISPPLKGFILFTKISESTQLAGTAVSDFMVKTSFFDKL